jgi:lipopolysaccharide transport system permease protein
MRGPHAGAGVPDAAALPETVRTATSGPPVTTYLNPAHLARGLWGHRSLIYRLARREVDGRYRGSVLGGLWAFVNPLVLLLIYTFVFGVVFRSRWPEAIDTGLDEFAFILFCGLIPFGIFSETIIRSPTVILNVPAYVKRAIFPLETLPVSLLGSVLVHGAVSVLVLLAARLILRGVLPWTVVLLPLVLVPLLFLTLGLAWFLASLGVFVRDITMGVTLVAQILLFVTPIFYPVTAIPPELGSWLGLSPLASVVENTRRVLLWGTPPDWTALVLWTVPTTAVLVGGYAWFMRSRRAFADVI